MRTVLLHHRPDPNAPSGPQFEAHFDWLVELTPEPDPEARTIPTWHAAQRLDLLTPARTCALEAIAPHRAFYLELRTPKRLSGERGLVTPVAWGTVVATDYQGDRAKSLTVVLAWAGGQRQRLRITEGRSLQCLAPESVRQ